jgi:hypothetical protein
MKHATFEKNTKSSHPEQPKTRAYNYLNTKGKKYETCHFRKEYERCQESQIFNPTDMLISHMTHSPG